MQSLSLTKRLFGSRGITSMKVLAVSTLSLLAVGQAVAQSGQWVNWQNDGNWLNAGNWNGGQVPGPGGDAWLQGTGNGGVSPALSGSGGSIGRLIVDNADGATIATGGSLTVSSQILMGNIGGSTGNFLTIDGGTLAGAGAAFALGIGSGADATLTINSGAVNTAGWLIAGYGAGSTGSIFMNGGTLTTAAPLYMGLGGTGSMLMTAGSATVAGLNMSALGGSLTIDGGVLTDTAGYAKDASCLITINGGGQLIFQNSGMSFADVEWQVANNGYFSTSGSLMVTDLGANSFMVSVAPVPEPSTLALAALGGVAFFIGRFRRNR